MKKVLLVLSSLAITAVSAQTTVISEGFDSVANMLGSGGWYTVNKSAPKGTSTWAQCGGTGIPPAHSGAETSCALVNFNSTTGAGTISNWLLTPAVTLQKGDIVSFYTRSPSTTYPDRLQVRLSTAGNSTEVGSSATSVGDFMTLLLDINPGYGADYPTAWTQFTATIGDLPAGATSRLAFRYFVENGGPSGSYSNIIGLDTFTVTRPALGVTEAASKEGLSIYPTVADKEVNISLKSGVRIKGVLIYDMSGKSTGVTKAHVFAQSRQAVDVSSLAKGAYIIKVLTDEGDYTSRFIKK